MESKEIQVFLRLLHSCQKQPNGTSGVEGSADRVLSLPNVSEVLIHFGDAPSTSPFFSLGGGNRTLVPSKPIWGGHFIIKKAPQERYSSHWPHFI